ncbi:Hypothetical_protein [Hexamita inflata]|uniref:Hypothetical_protein n=1 Tax=Hexamita inflata TaxID=28002 RepID=A0ABP1KCU5_9EUKA
MSCYQNLINREKRFIYNFQQRRKLGRIFHSQRVEHPVVSFVILGVVISYWLVVLTNQFGRNVQVFLNKYLTLLAFLLTWPSEGAPNYCIMDTKLERCTQQLSKTVFRRLSKPSFALQVRYAHVASEFHRQSFLRKDQDLLIIGTSGCKISCTVGTSAGFFNTAILFGISQLGIQPLYSKEYCVFKVKQLDCVGYDQIPAENGINSQYLIDKSCLTTNTLSQIDICVL